MITRFRSTTLDYSSIRGPVVPRRLDRRLDASVVVDYFIPDPKKRSPDRIKRRRGSP